ncbi:LacI family DNA-binding transcriptional regulator [Raineyella fluvialis]|uniref:LacI family DNA-binding transcriptional regulator n=1 Tax=Raineyella fluvialis TaxID=2662261 RepID=A0A5Q2F8I4_9ACTN|nr:LacI family DNA-binding transcriptional regulator [Raineyella fluvialis]QGF22978.1 LacI family DNA-binding transcriptional regulator [Raineyella fluvialis]
MATGTRPTQVDVARLAGVSRQTVSLVVLGDPRVSAVRRRAVQEAMEQLGYRPNIAARALATRRTGFVGISLSDLGNPFHADLVEELRRHCEAAGLIPFIAPVGEEPEEESVAVGRFLQMGVDGLILVSPLVPDRELADIGRQVPTILVTRNHGPATVDLVHTDDPEGARQAASQLIDAGYDPVVYVGFERGVNGDSSEARRRGYRAAMAEAGREPVEVHVDLTPKPMLAELVRQYSAGLGLCCHNDRIALEALGVLAEWGLEPGREAGVTGFDNTTIAGYPGVSLTSVDQATGEMARRVVELIGQRLDGRVERAEVVVPARLVVRRSSGQRPAM